MAFMYAAAGIYHFVNPDFYEKLMASWLPSHYLLNVAGGIFEMLLAAMLLSKSTRTVSAYLIMAMLVTFLFLIHIPMAINFYKDEHPDLWIAMIRIPIQFVLIWWAWLYIKPIKP